MDKYYLHPSSILSEDSSVGEGSKIWQFCHIFGKSSIGKNSILGQNVMVGPNVSVGSNCKIQNNVSIYSGIKIEDDVFCGPSCVFTNIKTPRAFINRSDEFIETIVRKGASIGANATIVCGNDIGPYALIGAGAVVTKSVKPYALLVGNPAKQLGWVSEFGHRLDFENGIAVCPESKQQYKLENDQVIRIS